MKVLLTGASGALGSRLQPVLQARGYTVQAWCYQAQGGPSWLQVDLRDAEAVKHHFQHFRPDILIHTAALTDVDACERFPEAAFALNVSGTLHLRQAIGTQPVKVVHVSTNDVFDGTVGQYTEADTPNPMNVYARTKYLAEQVWQDLPGALVVRATFLAPHMRGKTGFFAWVQAAVLAQRSLSVVTDQWNAPLSVGTLSEWLVQLLPTEGLCHLASERLSRYEQAMHIAQALGQDPALIQPCTRQDLAQVWRAPRPADVSLQQNLQARRQGLVTTFAQEVQQLLNGKL